jgi:hypothetical protein
MRYYPALLTSAAVFSCSLSACLTQTSGAARAQEAANDFNHHARFGRMELASEKLAAAARDELIKHRAGSRDRWHSHAWQREHRRGSISEDCMVQA